MTTTNPASKTSRASDIAEAQTLVRQCAVSRWDQYQGCIQAYRYAVFTREEHLVWRGKKDYRRPAKRRIPPGHAAVGNTVKIRARCLP
jgi:hypothetical protein